MMTRSTTPTNPRVCLACGLRMPHPRFGTRGVRVRVLRVHGCWCETVCGDCYSEIGGWLERFPCLRCELRCPPPFLCGPGCDAELHRYWGFAVGAVAGFGAPVVRGENGFRFPAAAPEEDSDDASGDDGEDGDEASGDGEEDESAEDESELVESEVEVEGEGGAEDGSVVEDAESLAGPYDDEGRTSQYAMSDKAQMPAK